jgi:hypothetical protein
MRIPTRRVQRIVDAEVAVRLESSLDVDRLEYIEKNRRVRP